jgi:hypothetical protein
MATGDGHRPPGSAKKGGELGSTGRMSSVLRVEVPTGS